MPERAHWKYMAFGGRKYAKFRSIDIGHREVRHLRDFVQPGLFGA
jgi:hypothetical protein